MEDYMESRPEGPRSELEKLSAGLYAAMTKKYADIADEVSLSYSVNGNPLTARISFKISSSHPSKDTTFILNHFHEDVQELLGDYEISETEYNIQFGSEEEKEQFVIISKCE